MLGGPHLCLFHPQETSGGFGLRFYSNDPAAFLSSTHSILEGALQSLVVMGSAVGKGTAQTLRTPDLAFSNLPFSALNRWPIDSKVESEKSCYGSQSTYPQDRKTAGIPCPQAFYPTWLHSFILP